MLCRLNIIEPWDSGTTKSIKATILKFEESQFLLQVQNTININGHNVQLFLCSLHNLEEITLLKKEISGVYEISMVYNKNIVNSIEKLPDMETFRSNFLSGELII